MGAVRGDALNDEVTEPDAIRVCPACGNPEGVVPSGEYYTQIYTAEMLAALAECKLCRGAGLVSASRAAAWIAEQNERDTKPPCK